MGDNKNGWLIGAGAALLGLAFAGKKVNDKRKEDDAKAKAKAKAERERLERQQYENSIMGKADKVFDALCKGIGDFARRANDSYDAADMQGKTDRELWEIAKYQAGAEAMGRSKAAMEELKRRGY